MFTFKVTGGKGQYTELPAVPTLAALEPGCFYFCVLPEVNPLSGEESNDVDMVHISLMDVKFAGSIKKNVKIVQFLKGRKFIGEVEPRHNCRLDQLPRCTFYGPMQVEVEAVEVGQVLEEITE
jgi:hypothetical protein